MREHQIRVKSEKSRRAQLVIISLLLAAIVCIACNSFIVQAGKAKPESYKYYTMVRAGRDDTLWNIAKEHISEEYASIQEYMSEVMEINSMISGDVYYGQRMMVPYYSEELK